LTGWLNEDWHTNRRTERLPDRVPDILSNQTYLHFPNFLSYHNTYTQENPRHFLMLFPNNLREPFLLDRIAKRHLSTP
jgi:hypothetical protein